MLLLQKPYTENLSLTDIVERIIALDYFKFVKLNHGFWQRICYFGAKTSSLEEVCNNIRKYVETDTNEVNKVIYDTPPLGDNRFSDVNAPPAVMAQSYPEILQLMQVETDILWGVSTSAHSNGPVYLEALKTIEKFGPRKTYNGLFWKDLVLSGEILNFFQHIKSHNVVVIGLQHLKQCKLPVDYHFFPIRMPVSRYTNQITQELEECHKRFKDEPVIYLSEMSDAGIPILCHAKLRNAFVFDLGRAIDVFTEEIDHPDVPWIKFIPDHLKEVYRGIGG